MSLCQTEISFYKLKSNHSYLTSALHPDFADGAKKHLVDLKARVDELEGMSCTLAEMHLVHTVTILEHISVSYLNPRYHFIFFYFLLLTLLIFSS